MPPKGYRLGAAFLVLLVRDFRGIWKEAEGQDGFCSMISFRLLHSSQQNPALCPSCWLPSGCLSSHSSADDQQGILLTFTLEGSSQVGLVYLSHYSI